MGQNVGICNPMAHPFFRAHLKVCPKHSFMLGREGIPYWRGLEAERQRIQGQKEEKVES